MVPSAARRQVWMLIVLVQGKGRSQWTHALLTTPDHLRFQARVCKVPLFNICFTVVVQLLTMETHALFTILILNSGSSYVALELRMGEVVTWNILGR